jgi:hypothetical protein
MNQEKMRKNSLVFLGFLVLLAACGGGDSYRKIRIELPLYSSLHPEEYQLVVFSGFLVSKEPEGIDLNREIIEYLSPDFERRLHFQVAVQPAALENEEVFRNADFWKALAPGVGRSLYITGKAEMTREIRKSVLGRAKSDFDEPPEEQKEIAERALFTLSLHLFLIRADSGEVMLEREFKESRAYPNAKQRADFAFYDLAQRIKTKLFPRGLSEERMQDRYLLVR